MDLIATGANAPQVVNTTLRALDEVQNDVGFREAMHKMVQLAPARSAATQPETSSFSRAPAA